jgi:hypothetical protein
MTLEQLFPDKLPRFLVCEDGDEYLERFNRFLGQEFQFIQSRDFETLVNHLESYQPIAAILLDLDFRRANYNKLVDESGQTVANVTKEQLARFVSNQGIAILAAIRKRGIQTKVLLFADLDDSKQQEYLERTFAPLELISSHVGLRELECRLVKLGNQ